MPSTAAERVHVAVAVLRNDRDEVLLTRRHAHSHQGGLWEFPGGKVEPGESLDSALRREIAEELGVTVLQHQPLLDVFHDYADKPVRLEVREVTQFSGEPTPLEGQPMRWVPRAQLVDYEFPRANVAIVECLLDDAAQEPASASDS
jgi:8-oxo-dGTP diphosphatase